MQNEVYAARQRNSWESIDGSILMPRHAKLQTNQPAVFSLLAVRHSHLKPKYALTPAQAQRKDSMPMARKEWTQVDNIVGLMDAEQNEFTVLQQLKVLY